MTSPPQQQQDPDNPSTGSGRNGLLIGVGVAAVLVTGGITLAVLFGGGDEERGRATGAAPGGSPASPPPHQEPPGGDASSDGGPTAAETTIRQVAEKAVTALNQTDVRLAESIACEPSRIGDDFGSALPAGTRVRLVGSPTVDGDRASVPTEFSGHGSPIKTDMPMRRDGDGWCVIIRAST